MGNQIGAALFHQLYILRGIGRIQRLSGDYPGTATMHLKSPYRSHDNGAVGNQAAYAALDIPELLKADVSAEAAFGDMIIGQLEGYLVGDDRRLADSDIGKRPGVHQHRLTFQGLEQVGVSRLHHPGGHGAIDFKVLGGNRVTLLIIGNDNL